MQVLPTPVTSSIIIQDLTSRKFYPDYESSCRNCDWVSFRYNLKQEAEDAGNHHAELCTAYLNAELAKEVAVQGYPVETLEYGQHVLLKDLRTMLVENIEVFDDEVMLTYSIDGDESEIMVLAVGHITKVVL